ncbi:MAG TPA: B12-binding domain-containing radical SAM protein [Treponemataceae bacterium]|nr:B12-binding domain-containing radical SAM protein [Treponemataceae bacterium]HPS43134.1 B12-binding domain-containing radical SAM protein [Treponemataceae bacterium]
MSPSQKPVLAVVSVQIQSSYQAIPLGAASVVSALRSSDAIARRVDPVLADYSLEAEPLANLSPDKAGIVLASRVAERYQAPAASADAAAAATSAPAARQSPPIVGFSVYVWNRTIFEVAATELKRLVPGIVIFAGGPEITANPGNASSTPFDYLIRGEGETATVALVGSILDGVALPQAIASGARCPDEDCAALSSPWLDGTLDGAEGVRAYKGALWELARGCPYDCAYCYESKGSRKVRAFPLARLERELDRFVEKGVERVFVLDPTYNASRERALSLLGLIERRAGEIHFNFEARAELIDRPMAEAFARIPCSLQIGLQSSNPEALKLVHRPADLSLFSKKIALLNEAGVTFGLDLMYGLPGDSLSTFRASLDYAIGLYPNNLEIFRLAVLPGTELADRAGELQLDCQKAPPYHVLSTPRFPAHDLDRAAELARAADIFYTQGRAVTWFLSALAPLKLKPSQFLQDFAAFLGDRAAQKAAGVSAPLSPCPAETLTHREAEALQLAFLGKKYREKGKAYLETLAKNIVALNGAWTRALAEGEESELDLSWNPDDLFSPDSLDLEYFQENAYMEKCRVRVFPTADGPDYSVFS